MHRRSARARLALQGILWKAVCAVRRYLAQRRKGAKKKSQKPEVFLCAFAPLREKIKSMTPELRALFPITQRAIYFNHAAISPPPITTIRAVEAQLRDVHENGSANFRSWLAVKEQARELLANLLGARPEQVAFMRNTSDALSTVANGIDWRAGDNIVTFRHEFPSNIYPWLRLRDVFGVEVRMCEERAGRIDLDELESLIDAKTRVVAVSHVQYASGFRLDLQRLGRLVRQRDALFVVDVIQALGVV